ncbi:hypothetical protein AO374_1481 [Moraxella catarrhalis]|nr:hypothetical protein AO374_1481 [Moraxella catarrhalis]
MMICDFASFIQNNIVLNGKNLLKWLNLFLFYHGTSTHHKHAPKENP